MISLEEYKIEKDIPEACPECGGTIAVSYSYNRVKAWYDVYCQKEGCNYTYVIPDKDFA